MKRRYRRWPPASSFALALIVLAILLRAGWNSLQFGGATDERRDSVSAEQAALVAGPCEVVRVVDGDTLIVRQPAATANKGGEPGGSGEAAQFRVRLLGVDTPETVKEGTPVEAWGPEATEFTRAFVRRGAARVELDKRRVDRFGRSLAYVYVGDEILNVELVRAGLARVSHYPGDSLAMLRLLRQAETEARQAEHGMWSDSGRGAPAPTRE